MKPWSAKQRSFVVEQYFKLGESVVAVRRAFKLEFKLKRHENPPDHKTILGWVKNFRETAKAVTEVSHGRFRTVRTENNIEKVREALTRSPGRSARRHSQALKIPRTTLRRIISEDLNMHPYKIQLTQELLPADRPKRLEFCVRMLDMLDQKLIDLEDVFFSDEAHFHLNGHVNKQNMRYYGTENPRITHPIPLHSPRVTVWCAMSAKTVIGPYFFEENGANVTVTGSRYLNMLNEFFLPSLHRKRISITRTWFQQDGATSHVPNDVLTLLKKKFPNRLISRNTDFIWPPRSPDLTPPDFFLWGHLKSRVYVDKPADIEALKSAIRREISAVKKGTLQKVIENFHKRLVECKKQRGDYLTGVLFKS